MQPTKKGAQAFCMQTWVSAFPQKNCVRYGLLKFSLSQTKELQVALL